MSENKRGGKRDGAGRPPEGKKKKVQMTAHVDEATKKEMQSEMKKAKLPTIGKLLDVTFKGKK